MFESDHTAHLRKSKPPLSPVPLDIETPVKRLRKVVLPIFLLIMYLTFASLFPPFGSSESVLAAAFQFLVLLFSFSLGRYLA